MLNSLLLFIFLTAIFADPQPEPPISLYDVHERYRDPIIEDRRFKHNDILTALSALPDTFHQSIIGHSVEGRSIHLVSIGEGPIDVLLWSQMHGNEPTATMAILDIFRFFAASDEFDALRQLIISNCTLHFIPMLNPDGAERFQRRNANGVDLNRDALRLQNPESRILKRIRDSLQADWGFNLHDQSRYYAAGTDQPFTASISFLAPAYNRQKSTNIKREDAMQLIGLMNRTLQKYIPNKVGKYNDTFEPRAFGDNIQKWGTRTILIETGGLKDDPEKQELRRLNFTILMKAFEGIASGAYEDVSRSEYLRLPYNRYNSFHDLILREVIVPKGNEKYTFDIAFRRLEKPYNNYRSFYPVGNVSDLGDLSTSFAYTDLPAAGLIAEPAKVYPQAIAQADQVKALDLWKQLQEGYLIYRLTGSAPEKEQYHRIPIGFLGSEQNYISEIQLETNPTLLLKKNNAIQFVVVNGYLYDLREGRTAFESYLQGKL
ncbi:MAG: peptidase M14 [Saprospiraceae bacterium]|nr:peptidase M14 [Saprospiraceae bacterium]